MRGSSLLWIPGAVLFLLETGLQLSGITDLPLAILLWSAAAVLICWGTRAWYKERRKAGMISVEPSHLIAFGLIGVAVSGAVAAGGYIWRLYRIPAAVLPGIAQGYPIAWEWVGWNQSSTDGYAVFRVGGIRFVGKNVSEKEVLFNSAYIISGITGAKLTPKLLLPGTEPKDANPIPPGANEIILDAKFGGLVTEEEYLKEWSTFYLVSECDG